MKDPYLVKGQVCEIWNSRDQYVDTAYFWKFCTKTGNPIFVESYYRGSLDVNNIFQSYKYYRPIGTEWDFAPDWAVCSTVDKDGALTFWSSIHIGIVRTSELIYTGEWGSGTATYLNGGICPDKTRYQGSAWKSKDSLRMRPAWAAKRQEE